MALRGASGKSLVNDSKGLRTFRDEYRAEAPGGLLLHGGDKTYWVAESVLAAPWWKVI